MIERPPLKGIGFVRPKTRSIAGGERRVQVGEVMQAKSRLSLSAKEKEHHTHVIGSTGTGKSKLLEYLIRQDIRNPKVGLCLIDPHGSLYDDILLHIAETSPRLAERVVLFYPASDDYDHILGFNPIPENSGNVDYLVNMLMSAVLKSLGQDSATHTPRIARWLKNIFYPLVVNNLTLLEAAPFFNIYDKERRQDILKTVRNEQIITEWIEFDKMSPKDRSQTIEGAANRLVNFLENRAIRHMIGQSRRTLDLAEIMDEGKILLVNLNGGVNIPQENTHLLGVMLVNELFRVSKLRDPRDPNLKPFHVYIDEFGQYVTRDIARALEECRKYKLFMTLAHQHLAQLRREDEYLYASVMTNCKNKIVFGGLAKDDADVMAEEIATGFLDLKSIKDEMHSTKVRHVEETRVVRSASTSRSRTEGKGGSSSTGRSEGLTEADNESTSVTEGRSHTSGETQGSHTSTSLSSGTSRSMTHTETKGRTESFSATEGTSEGASRSEGGSRTSGTSRSLGAGEGRNRSTGAETRSRSRNETATDSSGKSWNESKSWGRSRSETHGHSTHSSNSVGHMEGTSENHSETEGQSHSQMESHGESRSEGRTTGHSVSRSVGTSESHSESWSTGETTGESAGESIVPFLRPEEYTEITSRTFWSLEELKYMQAAAIKTQGTGQAFVKINTNAPVQVQVDFVRSARYSPRFTPKKIDRFVRAVFHGHADYYTPLPYVREDYETRQRALFRNGEPIVFDELPLLIEGEVAAVPASDHLPDPFTDH